MRVSGVRGEPPPPTTQGLHQLPRRLPQLDDLRADRPRRRGEGRARRADAAGSCSAGASASHETHVQLVRTDRAGPATQRGGDAPPPRHREGSATPQKVGRALRERRRRDGARQLPGLLHARARPRDERRTASTGRRSCPRGAVEQRRRDAGRASGRRSRQRRRRSGARRAVPRAGARAPRRRPARRAPRRSARSAARARATRAATRTSACGRGAPRRTPGSSHSSRSSAFASCCPRPPRSRCAATSSRTCCALNFVVTGSSATASPRRPTDPQAKSLGEYLRSRWSISRRRSWTPTRRLGVRQAVEAN